MTPTHRPLVAPCQADGCPRIGSYEAWYEQYLCTTHYDATVAAEARRMDAEPERRDPQLALTWR